MDMSKLISVIVPVYKVEPFLDRCVKSILSQTYTNLEVILVDDGSPDNCPAMCDDWKNRDNRIKVIHKKNGGLSEARNVGMSMAVGEFISFVDSDDWIASEMLSHLINAIIKDNSDIAACSVEMIWENKTQRKLMTAKTNCVLNSLEAQKALIDESLLKHPVWYKLYRKDVIKDIPFRVGKYHEDVFWSYLVIGNSTRVSIVDYVGYFYTQRLDSIMGESYSIKRLDALEAYEERAIYMKVHFPELEVKAKTAVLNACIYNGQMALRYLPLETRKQVFNTLNQIIRKNDLRLWDIPDRKFTHLLWMILAKVSLKNTCKIKNTLGIGL